MADVLAVGMLGERERMVSTLLLNMDIVGLVYKSPKALAMTWVNAQLSKLNCNKMIMKFNAFYINDRVNRLKVRCVRFRGNY